MRRTLISYDWGLIARVRELRLHMTQAEAILWRELKGRKVLGCRFARQCPIDRYIVDFHCRDLSLAIEVDAITHDDSRSHPYDRERDMRLRLSGIAVLRFTDEEIVHNLDGVLSRIRQSIRYLPWRRTER